MLSKRLKSLVKYVNKKDKILDVGCDHALLDIYLIEEKVIDKIVVSDNKEDALNNGINNIKKRKLNKVIATRLGDGLDVLKKDDVIDTIIISGMGSNTIIKILKTDKLEGINKLIIQANNDHYLLRKEVTKLGFYIEKEEYFQDNKKNYINIVFKRGYKKYQEKELMYGPILIKDKAYLEFELSNIEKINKLLPKKYLRSHLKLYLEKRYLENKLKEC